MKHTFMTSILLALLLLAGLPAAAPAAAQTSERCFAETGYCISGPIRAYWERNGGLPVFGYPISEQRVETVEDRTIPVQWFERDRLEIQADGMVTAGRHQPGDVRQSDRIAISPRPWSNSTGGPFPAVRYEIVMGVDRTVTVVWCSFIAVGVLLASQA
jgi:hypothetical protein